MKDRQIDDFEKIKGSRYANDFIKLIEQDGLLYPGMSYQLSVDDWKKISGQKGRIFYTSQQQLAELASSEINSTLSRLSDILRYKPDIPLNKITVFILTPEQWRMINVPNAFYLSETSQIYLLESPQKRFVSSLNHEITHYIIENTWSEVHIPLWIQEGLATRMENPYCIEQKYARQLYVQENSQQFNGSAHLKDILMHESGQNKPDMEFYFDSYLLIKFIEGFSDHGLAGFLPKYISSKDKTVNGLVAALKQAAQTKLNSEEVINQYNQFLNSQSRQNKAMKTAFPDVQFTDIKINLGEVRGSDGAEVLFDVINNLNEPVELEAIYDCGNLTMKNMPHVLSPGQSGEIKVVVSQSLSKGKMSEEFLVKIKNGDEVGVRILTLEANVVEEYSLQRRIGERWEP